MQEGAGKTPRMNSSRARARADDLQGRLRRRLEELEQERHLSPQPPVVLGGALVVPVGLLMQLAGEPEPAAFSNDTAAVEAVAMAAVMEAERRLGFVPRDVSAEKCGYDVESKAPVSGKLRFLEVKGRISGADSVTVTKNEVLTALNKPDDFVLAIVEVENGNAKSVRYVRRPFVREPDFGVTNVTYKLRDLLERSSEPS